MRIALSHRIRYYKNVLKINNDEVERPPSNIIVDSGHFRQNGIFSNLMNRFHNSNSIFQIKRGVDGFTVPDFEKQALAKYQMLCKFYAHRTYRQMPALLSDNLLQKFKALAKTTPKTQNIDLGWNLLADANNAKIVQARVHQQKLSSIKVSDRWFQLTCKFTNPQGKQVYNVLEKHEKNKDFKFVKFDV